MIFAGFKPGIPTTAALVRMQGVPLLPSGQQPPMYARNHLNFWREGALDVRNRKLCFSVWVDLFQPQIQYTPLNGRTVPYKCLGAAWDFLGSPQDANQMERS